MFFKKCPEAFIFFLVIFGYGCDLPVAKSKQVCGNHIRISVFDSSADIADYTLYEVTNYPEGVVMKLETVSGEHIYKDSSGIICLHLLEGQGPDFARKFVLVKTGYVYTQYFLRNTITDTVLSAIKIKPGIGNSGDNFQR